MSPADALARARATAAQAELAAAAGDQRTAQALRGAAAAWERLARPGVPWSLEPARQQLTQLKRDFAAATGPFQPPALPKAPSPAAAPVRPSLGDRLAERYATEAVTIEF